MMRSRFLARFVVGIVCAGVFSGCDGCGFCDDEPVEPAAVDGSAGFQTPPPEPPPLPQPPEPPVSPSPGWVWQNPPPDGEGTGAIRFATPSIGWMVGASGTIRRSTDGGTTWTLQSSGVTAFLRDIASLDGVQAWIVGDGGIVLRTADAGVTWTPSSVAPATDLRGVRFATNLVGYAAGGGGIWKSVDGGVSWIQSYVETTAATFWDIDLVDADHVWAAGTAGRVARTADGGSTWTTKSLTTPPLNSIEFIDSSRGFALPSIGPIYKTSNGGENWVSQVVGSATHAWSSAFAKPIGGAIYLAGRLNQTGNMNGSLSAIGKIYKSTDGGQTWIEKFKDERFPLLSRITFADPYTGWASGPRGGLLKSSDGGETWSPIGGANNGIQDISFADSQNGWAVGGGGMILRTTNGGANWSLQSGAPVPWNASIPMDIPYSLNSIAVIDANTAFVAGGRQMGTVYGGALIQKTTNGGATWTVSYGTSFSSTLGYRLTALDFADSQHGCAVGTYGTFLRTSDGGTTWTPSSWGTSYLALTDVDFPDALVGYVGVWKGGPAGAMVRKTTDGGATWVDLALPGPTLPSDFRITFLDTLQGWVVGNNGYIRKTLDGGATWTPPDTVVPPSVPQLPELITFFHLRDVAFANSTMGWIAGSNGAILKTMDGGATWNPMSAPGIHYNSLCAFDPTHVWVAGAGGAILKHMTGGE